MAAYTYILTNPSRMLYGGMTDNLRRRVFEHKTQLYDDAFTARYRVTQLAYYEVLPDGNAALARERQLKGWTRAKKTALVERANPGWFDVSDAWYSNEELTTLTLVERPFVVPDLLLPALRANCASPSAG
jgi:putative endonuclease